MKKETGKPFATAIRAEVVWQHIQHAQRVGIETLLETTENIIFPRVFTIGQDVPQRNVINRYSGLHCNGAEVRIKSLTITKSVQSSEAMEFTANYTPTDYDAVVTAIPASGDQYYQIEFGDSGADGKFYWQGTHSVRITGGDVNAVREMVITVIPSTAVTKATT